MEKFQEAVVSQHFREFCCERVERLSLNEKIQIVYEYLMEMKLLPVLQPKSSKSIRKAVELKNIGNREYGRGENVQALLYYTKCIAFAPAHSEELAFAYANRSIALLKLQRYHECLRDINRALQENYPKTSKKKLLVRKKTCVAKFQEAVAFSKKLPDDLGQHYLLGKASVEELEKSLDPDGTEPPPHMRIPPPKIDFKNKLIPNASGKIKIQITPEDKINIVATADMNPGEVLAVEEPFLWGLKEEFSFSHCAYCFVYTESLIHCPNCSVVMFCSNLCREKACEKFHRIECQIFSMLPPESEEVSLMTWAAFRVVLVATKQGEKLDEMMNHPVYKFPLSIPQGRPNVKGQFNSQDYSSVFHHGQFSSANSFNDFSSGLSLNPLMTVATWTYLLKHTSFFGGQTRNFKEPLTSRELYVASCFLRSLQCDFRTIKEGFVLMSEIVEDCKTRATGYGLFPFMNLFGHSCEPHVAMYSYENNLVCRAIRPIKAGDQIFDCYGDPYYKSPKHERISSLLENYNFECKCRACRRNWPTKEKLSPRFSKMVSDTIGAKKFQEYAAGFIRLKIGADFQSMSKAKALEFLCEYSSILDKRFERPCREFIECGTLLNFSMWTVANFYHVISE